MRLIANEKSIPRIHLVGTLLIVLLLTVGLVSYNLWQSRQDAQSSFDRIEHALTELVEARLKAEMRNAMATIEFIRSQTEAVLRASIVQQVDNAYQIVETIHSRESVRRPAAEVGEMIVETLRPVRFYDGRGYFFIDDMNGQFILLPTSPQLEGKTLLDNQDDTGHFIMRGLIAAARLPRGEGFSRYRWYAPENQTVMADKLSYVRFFKPYDWLIGTGDYLHKWEERQKLEAILRLRTHRFGTTGDVALFDVSGGALILPSNTALENKSVADLPAFERSVLEKLLSTAQDGGGIVHYDWPQTDNGRLVKKTAYVQIYEPWQWIVVTTQFDDETLVTVAAEQQTHTQMSTRQALTIALGGLAALLIGLTASWMFSLWTRQLFEGYHRNNLAQQDALRQQADALHETQASLQEREHHFRTLANGGTALIWTSGVDKLCNYFNEPWLRYTGRTLEQELGNGWTEGVHPDDYNRCLNFYVSHFDRREPFSMEYRLRKANGEYGWILDLGNPRYDSEGNFLGYIGFCYEITERRRADELLRQSEERFLLAMKASNDGLFDWNLETNEIYYSPAWKKMLGYEDHELPNDFLVWEKTTDPEDVKKSWELQRKLISKEIDRFEIEFKMRHKDGHWVDILSRAEAFLNDSGKAVRMVGTHVDISESKRAQESLRASEERNRQIIHSSIDGFMRVDTQARLIEVNDAYCRMSGYSREELLTKVVPDLEALESTDEVAARIRRIRENGSDRFTTSHRRKDGRIFEVEVSIQYRSTEDGGEFAIFLRDVTEKRHLESQLQQAQKMESVGRLAGGVAHDFNNMLAVILGHTEMALDDVDPAAPLHASLQAIQYAAERSATLTRQLLAFARKQTVAPKVVDINDAVAGMLNMLRRLIGEDIDLLWCPAEDLPPIKVDPAQIDQLLANLCVNARDAIDGVGKITIETALKIFDEAYCADHLGFLPGEYVLIEVSDDGCGMDQTVLNQIFEPFFTTKEQGKGTGLGLASVFGMVKQNNGFINVYSEPGQGTTFKIYLPVYTAKSDEVVEKAPELPAERGHETILLVEDEPAILQMTTMMLERQGYTVLAAATPGKAIRLVHEYRGRIDLLMTDVVMPEMNGRELAGNLLSHYPDLKRLFMSGYTADIIAHHGVLNEGVHFIQKPFSMKDVGGKLRETLED